MLVLCPVAAATVAATVSTVETVKWVTQVVCRHAGMYHCHNLVLVYVLQTVGLTANQC